MRPTKLQLSRYFVQLALALLLGAVWSTTSLLARDFAVVVYNVENLHDIDGVAAYDDYQPAQYGAAHLAVKASNIAKVLAKVNKGAGPEIVLFNEIELDQTPDSTVADYPAWLARHADTTLEQMLSRQPLPAEFIGLPAEAWLLKACTDAGLGEYHVATTSERPGNHADGRSVAVRNLIFSRFPILETRSHPTPNARAILEVHVDIEGKRLVLFNNHWKSGASSTAEELVRIENARTLRTRLDELFAADPSIDVIIGGDLNSHYNQKQRYRAMRTTGINDVLGSQGNELALRGKNRDLYNLWFELPSDQRGSDTFQGEWGTLMHLIVSRGLYDQNGIQYADNSFAVMKFTGLNANALGLPNRWSRGRTPAGFSDHFPLYARFRTVDTNAKDKWMPLSGPSETETDSGAAIKIDTSPVNIFASAIKPADLPPGTDIRDGTFTGRIFELETTATVNDRGHIKMRIGDLEYDIYSHTAEIRDRLRETARAGRTLRFYGELGQYRGAWQFVVQGKEWVR